MGDNTLYPRSAPPIPGLRFRGFHPPDDYANMAAIARAAAQVDGTERADTAEELAEYFAHLTNSDPFTDMIFAETALSGTPIWKPSATTGRTPNSKKAIIRPG